MPRLLTAGPLGKPPPDVSPPLRRPLPSAPFATEAEPAPFFVTVAFETAIFGGAAAAAAAAAAPAFMGRAAATSFPINFGFFTGGDADVWEKVRQGRVRGSRQGGREDPLMIRSCTNVIEGVDK